MIFMNYKNIKIEDLDLDKNYALVICEKPHAAHQIANLLADDNISKISKNGIEGYELTFQSQNYLICAASGHLFTLNSKRRKNTSELTFPQWAPIYKKQKNKTYLKNRINFIEELGSKSKTILNACDYDLEGEVIGYNIINNIFNYEDRSVYRVKFSSFTEQEIRDAFSSPYSLNQNLINAGLTRHIVDFMYGINVSREFSNAYMKYNNYFKKLSIGRVQGPTLNFIVEREIAINSFISVPYWKIRGTFIDPKSPDKKITADYEISKIENLSKVNNILDKCRKNKISKLSSIVKILHNKKPPKPFNLSTLQSEASRAFRFSPTLTMSIAEKLYLHGLISYPRTTSQELPPHLDIKSIIKNLSHYVGFRNFAQTLLSENSFPKSNYKIQDTHPAIYPTGIIPNNKTTSQELKLYELIVHRFFSSLGVDSKWNRIRYVIDVNGNNFVHEVEYIVDLGWMHYYDKYVNVTQTPKDLNLIEGQILNVIRIQSSKKFEDSPKRYSHIDLLKKMEREDIGTKSTRAYVINTLKNRGYTSGSRLQATNLAFAVCNISKKYIPDIISTSMTRSMERDLTQIETGVITSEDVLTTTETKLFSITKSMKSNLLDIGLILDRAVKSNTKTQSKIPEREHWVTKIDSFYDLWCERLGEISQESYFEQLIKLKNTGSWIKDIIRSKHM